MRSVPLVEDPAPPFAPRELLLRAAVLPGRAAVDAWNSVRPGLDLDALDRYSHWLLPMLFRNLRDEGVEDAAMPRLKGMYRRTWYANHLLLRDAAAILRALAEDGIDTLVLKGLALLDHYYGDRGARQMGDFDVLVPPERARQAAALVAGMGWQPMGPVERYLARWHSVPFRRLGQWEVRGLRSTVDLHWVVSPWLMAAPDAVGQEMRERSVPLVLEGVPTRALDPVDQLLHVCVHGATTAVLRGDIRWAADAYRVIVRSGAAFPWERTAERAGLWHAVPYLRDALEYLVTSLETPVPAWVLDELRRLPVSRRERLAHRIYVRRAGGRGPSRHRLVAHFLRWTAHRTPLGVVAAIPGFLRWRIGPRGLRGMVHERIRRRRRRAAG